MSTSNPVGPIKNPNTQESLFPSFTKENAKPENTLQIKTTEASKSSFDSLQEDRILKRSSLKDKKWTHRVKSFFSAIGDSIVRIFKLIFGRISKTPAHETLNKVSQQSHVDDQKVAKNSEPLEPFISDEVKNETGGESDLKNDSGLLIHEKDSNEDLLEKEAQVQKEISEIDEAFTNIYALVISNLEEDTLSVLPDVSQQLEKIKERLEKLDDSVKEKTAFIEDIVQLENQIEEKIQKALNASHSDFSETNINLEDQEIFELENNFYDEQKSFEKSEKSEITPKKPYNIFSPLFGIFNSNSSSIQKPAGINVKGINACYRNASNQAILAVGSLRKLIATPLEKGFIEEKEDYQKRENIRQLLNEFFETLEQHKPDLEVQLAEAKVLDAIIESGYGTDEITKELRTEQQDIGSYLGIIINNVLNYNYRGTNIKSNGDYSTQYYEILSGLVDIPIPEGINDLQELVELNYLPTNENDDWGTFTSYNKDAWLIGEPKDALVIQLKRSAHKEPINVPEELDFSSAFKMEKGKLLYNVKSFSMHEGWTAEGGHYVSYVNKDGKWFLCNDEDVTQVSKEFAEEKMKEAYILFFERKK